MVYRATREALAQFLSYDFDPDVNEGIQSQFQLDANRIFGDSEEFAFATDEATGIVLVRTSYISIKTNAEYEALFWMEQDPESKSYGCVKCRMIRRPFPDIPAAE